MSFSIQAAEGKGQFQAAWNRIIERLTRSQHPVGTEDGKGETMSEIPTIPKRRGRPPGTPSATHGERFKADIAPVEPLAVGAKEAAALCGIGLTLWRNMGQTGQVPAFIKLGGRCVWSLDELRRWIAAGSPNRERWEILKKSNR